MLFRYYRIRNINIKMFSIISRSISEPYRLPLNSMEIKGNTKLITWLSHVKSPLTGNNCVVILGKYALFLDTLPRSLLLHKSSWSSGFYLECKRHVTACLRLVWPDKREPLLISTVNSDTCSIYGHIAAGHRQFKAVYNSQYILF